jgi:hypothetical protein
MSPRKVVDSPVVAKLTGGLGNQIFIYAAALEQARRLGVNIGVDTSWYKDKSDRFYRLEQLFGAPLHEANSSKLGQALEFARPLLKQFDLWGKFQERSSRFQPEIFQIRPGTTIEGYFQSPKYFPSVGAEIAESIRNVIVSSAEQDVIDDVSSRPFNAIHVRRGDYLTESHTKEIHGLTSRKYYESSLALIGGRGIPCIVFTDSPQEAEQELAGISELVFDSRLHLLGDIATLKLMTLASGIVMSNSSFSWWAAYTISHFDRNCTVISPRPWTGKVDFNEELIDPSWWNVGM